MSSDESYKGKEETIETCANPSAKQNQLETELL